MNEKIPFLEKLKLFTVKIFKNLKPFASQLSAKVKKIVFCVWSFIKGFTSKVYKVIKNTKWINNFYKNKKLFYGCIAGILIALALLLLFILKPEEEIFAPPKYEPAPPEAPRLNGLYVDGYSIDFSPEERYYEVKIPLGNPYVPEVSGSAVAGVKVEEYQAYLKSESVIEENDCTSAMVYLDDGTYTNFYEIKFIQSEEYGCVLQYDDRYTFVPDYELKEGETYTYSLEESSGNIEVDSNGVIKVLGLSDTPATVNAYVGDKKVDSLTVDKTVKALLNVFIIAGQGNAAGEGGNLVESIMPLAGTCYTAEVNDRKNEMKDLSAGRAGFSPALAAKWYDLTREKVFVLQTAVSNVSVTDWRGDGEVYQMAKKRIDYFKEALNSEESMFIVKRTVCFWLQGEWDISKGMTVSQYKEAFLDFRDSIKNDAGVEQICIIPVRSALNETENVREIQPVCAAQYIMSSEFDDIRIITEFPESATRENGYISEGNLYYTQTGFNLLGEDIARNLYGTLDSMTDRKVEKIKVFGNVHDKEYINGETVQIKKDESLQIITLTLPLYAEKSDVKVEYDENKLTFTSDNVLKISENNSGDEASDLIFTSGDFEFKLIVSAVVENDDESNTHTHYNWEFEGLSTTESDNNELTLSERSAADGYRFENGILTSDRQADFKLENNIILSYDKNWTIEWKGMLSDNSILLGNEYSTNGYIFLAPYTETMAFAIRIVDDNGKKTYIPYMDSASKNSEMNVWKLEYNKSTGMICLYLNNDIIQESEISKEFKLTLTNLLGRYGSDNVNYCYTGSLDYLKINLE